MTLLYFSEVTESQEMITKQQEMISSLNLQLIEKNEMIKELKAQLKSF